MKRPLIILLVFSMIFINYVQSQDTLRIPGRKFDSPVNENIYVYRIEIRIVTASSEYDGTDNEVYVQLNSDDDHYFLDYGRDDFNRNSDLRFDILSEHIVKISDIDFIKLGVKRNDQWGIKKIELYLNNSPQPVFSHTYSPQIVLNHAQGKQDQFVISSSALRANDSWKKIQHNVALTVLPVPVKFSMIKSVVESLVGNQIHHSGDGNLQWGSTDDVNTVWGDWVEGNYASSNKLHFDLDLEYAVSGAPDAEIDVDFDLVFNCDDGKITIKTENVKTNCRYLGAKCSGVINAINTIIGLFGVDPIRGNTQNYQNNFTRIFSVNTGDHGCRGVVVRSGGDVVIF